MTCLGVDARAPTETKMDTEASMLAKVRSQRAELQAAFRVSKLDASWTHESCDGERFRMNHEQALSEQRLFCSEFLLSNGAADALSQAPEKAEQKQARTDAAVAEFLVSQHVVKEEGARVSHADFAAALRREMKLKNVSQHSISSACKRAGLEALASHAARFWLNLKLTVPPT